MIPVLVGPTASGKTAVAHAASRLAAIDIIAADSRTIYRGLDIGTAKPSEEERRALTYHGIDIAGPEETYTAGRFARDAAGWIREAALAGRIPLVVGGTGFYVRALFEGLFEEPPMDTGRRARLRKLLATMDRGELARWAGRLDAAYSGGLNTQRAARAAEVALLTGRPISRHHMERKTAGFAVPRYARLELPRAELHRRIAGRARRMLEQGLVEEVRAVLARGVDPAAPGLTGVGYREVVAHLLGRLPAGELEERIITSTRQYAKRQETWFRHQLPPETMVLDATLPPDTLAARLLSP